MWEKLWEIHDFFFCTSMDASQSEGCTLTTLLQLPAECLAHVLSFVSIVDVCRACATCPELHAVVSEPSVWIHLLSKVFAIKATHPHAARADFVSKIKQYRQLSKMPLETNDSKLLSSPLNVIARFGLDAHRAHSIEVRYLGTSAQSHASDTVGVACANELRVWPCGDGASVSYFEVEVVDAGESGFIAVGWAPEDYPLRKRQPGWERNTYGYHGDDGRVYSATGYGRRFSTTFTTGQVIGSGLIRPRGSSKATIFYTRDGEMIGTPFTDVERPSRLRPTVGLHSPGERCVPHAPGWAR